MGEQLTSTEEQELEKVCTHVKHGSSLKELWTLKLLAEVRELRARLEKVAQSADNKAYHTQMGCIAHPHHFAELAALARGTEGPK